MQRKKIRKKIQVLVIGNGGREHSIVKLLSRSKRVEKIYCAAGNPGIEEQAQIVPIQPDQVLKLRDFAENQEIDWSIVGSELPLSLGLVDSFQEKGLKCLGVNQKASQLESSKVFTKELLLKYQIPTASFQVFEDFSTAESFFKKNSSSENNSTNTYPWVIKVDGLAQGKGVYIPSDQESAKEALYEIFIEKRFQEQRIVAEEFLQGKEISVFALSDGQNLLPFFYAQDFKKRDDGDQGPNTGGMGAFTPVSWMSKQLQRKILKEILEPTLNALKNEGIFYQGILYAGLMVQGDRIRVLEYNIRLGDPEAQAILPLLQTDFVDILDALESQRFHELQLEWKKESSVCVSIASQGYPLKYEQGFPISGIEKAQAIEGIEILHAGTRRESSQLLTSGGRVLHVVATATSLEKAKEKVYQAVDLIQFQNRFFRKDIAQRELEELHNKKIQNKKTQNIKAHS